MLRSRKTIGMRAAVVLNTVADPWCRRAFRARPTIVFNLRSLRGSATMSKRPGHGPLSPMLGGVDQH